MKNKNDLGLLILRLAFGGLMLYSHGWGKLMKVFAGNFKFADPIGIGAAPSLVLASFAEAICAILIMIGLYTRWSTIPLIITMAVAVFFVHLDDPFNKIEFASLYLFGYIAIYLMGPGAYSLDAYRKKA